MKKLMYLSLLIVFIISCSSTISIEKMKYIKSAIICDSKKSEFKIVNMEELEDFFDNRREGNIKIKYEYQKVIGVNIKRDIELGRMRISNHVYYLMDFNRLTFPRSECRRLKSILREF